MAWIESHQSLKDHPKTHHLARLLGVDLDSALGKLHRFWYWCTDYAEDGDLRKHGVEVISDSLKFDAQALVEARWVDTEPYLRVHDWWDWSGRYWQSKYKKSPEKWQRIKGLYQDGTREVPVTGHLPTYLPNLPTNLPTMEKGSGNGSKNSTSHRKMGPSLAPPAYPKANPASEPERALSVAFRILKDIPQASWSEWDKTNLPGFVPQAQRLIQICGTFRRALSCMQDLADRWNQANLKNWGIDGIIKNSYEWVGQNAGREGSDNGLDYRKSDSLDADREPRRERKDQGSGGFASTGEIIAGLRDVPNSQSSSAKRKRKRDDGNGGNA